MKNAQFEKALAEGHLVPAMLPDGSPFVCNEVQYYQAGELYLDTIYAGRFAALGDTLRQHDTLKLSGDLLDTSLSSLRDLTLTGLQRVNDPAAMAELLSELHTMALRLQQRASMGTTLEVLYDTMAVVFLDETEDPRSLSLSHSAKKKTAWAEHPHLLDFFLTTPINKFVPLQGLFEPDTIRSTRNQMLLEWLDWQRITLLYGPDGLTRSTNTSIALRMETLRGFDSLLQPRSLSTTTTS